MAKKSMVLRDEKRKVLVAKYYSKRQELKAKVMDLTASADEKNEAMRQLLAMPRDSSPSRIRNRCHLTGRPRGYYCKFGLSRSKLRESMLRGEVPGVVKASW